MTKIKDIASNIANYKTRGPCDWILTAVDIKLSMDSHQVCKRYHFKPPGTCKKKWFDIWVDILRRLLELLRCTCTLQLHRYNRTPPEDAGRSFLDMLSGRSSALENFMDVPVMVWLSPYWKNDGRRGDGKRSYSTIYVPSTGLEIPDPRSRRADQPPSLSAAPSAQAAWWCWNSRFH